MPMLYDFECADCENQFEQLVSSSDVSDSICPACGGPSKRRLSAVNLGFMNDQGRQKEALMKRSKEHTLKQMKRNPQRLADLTGGTPRAQTPWNLRSRKKDK